MTPMTPRAAAGRSARAGIRIVLLILLLVYAAHEAREDFPYQYAFDLYHPWGIAAARENAAAPANPYRETAAFGAFAGDAAERSPSRALRAAGRFWQGRNAGTRFEPTGTPLYYAALSSLPADFDRAHAAMTLLQFASLAFAVAILGRLRRWPWLACFCVAALAASLFNPFTQDVKFANAAALQTACVAGLVALAARGRRAADTIADRLYLALLAVLVLFKPNTGLIALALAAHYGFARGPRRFAEGCALAGVAALTGVALSAWYFHEPAIWLDWYRYVRGANGGTLLYPAADGNLSLVKMLSERGAGHGVGLYAAMTAAAFGLLVATALTAMGKAPARLIPGARAALADPWLVASAGVLATFVVAPLVWPHYWVLLAVPMLRFVAWEGRWDGSTTLTLVAFVALSRWPLQWLVEHAPAAIYVFMLFSWMPLLPALGLQLARTSARATGPVVDSTALGAAEGRAR
jgi:hypothetical protein